MAAALLSSQLCRAAWGPPCAAEMPKMPPARPRPLQLSAITSHLLWAFALLGHHSDGLNCALCRSLLEMSTKHRGVALIFSFCLCSPRRQRSRAGPGEAPCTGTLACWKLWSSFRAIKAEGFIELKCEGKCSQPARQPLLFLKLIPFYFFTLLIAMPHGRGSLGPGPSAHGKGLWDVSKWLSWANARDFCTNSWLRC